MIETSVLPPAPGEPPKKRGRATTGMRYGGRVKGTKNRVTVEREEAARLDLERERLLQEARAAGAKKEIAEAAASGKRLMKEILFDFASLFAGLAMFYHPWPNWTKGLDGTLVNANPNYDEAKFKEYAILAKETAHAGAPFQSPRYSAVIVGASVVTKVQVDGGMPNDFEPSKLLEKLEPGTVITADDVIEGIATEEPLQKPLELPKAANG